MLMSKKLNPGQPGTKRLVNQYGARLVCVRYRYDAARDKRFKTVELIIEEDLWQPPVRPFRDDEIVTVRVEFSEVALCERVKLAGGRWNPPVKAVGNALWCGVQVRVARSDSAGQCFR